MWTVAKQFAQDISSWQMIIEGGLMLYSKRSATDAGGSSLWEAMKHSKQYSTILLSHHTTKAGANVLRWRTASGNLVEPTRGEFVDPLTIFSHSTGWSITSFISLIWKSTLYFTWFSQIVIKNIIWKHERMPTYDTKKTMFISSYVGLIQKWFHGLHGLFWY